MADPRPPKDEQRSLASRSNLKVKSKSLAARSAVRSVSRLRAHSRAKVHGDGHDAETYFQVKDPVAPHDQLELSEEELGVELTRILRADNPHAPDNIVRFSHKEGAYRQMSGVDQCEFHFSLSGTMVHKESDEARRQLAKTKFARPSKDAGTTAVEDKPEAAEEAAEEATEAEDGSETAVADEGGEGGEPAEGDAAKGAEGEDEEEQAADTQDSGTGTDGDKVLRNQFNFSERASQTSNYVMRERGTMTEAPLRRNFAANATQWAMYDAYTADLARQAAAKETKKKKSSDKDKKPSTTRYISREEEDSASSWSAASKFVQLPVAKKIERLVNQNTFDEVTQDFRYWDDPSDPYKEPQGSLLPLWKFSYDKAKKKTVTAVVWGSGYKDLVYVGYGSYDFAKQSSGMICVYTLKRPSHPEYIIPTEHGVMSLDIHSDHPSLLVAGLYNGDVAVYDLSLPTYDVPVIQSTAKTGKHTDPVWQVKWHSDDVDNNRNFTSVSSDGRVTSWTIVQTELQHNDIIRLSVESSGPPAPGDPLLGLGTGTCLAFSPHKERIFLVGTEEGQIHMCSKAYSSKYLQSFEAHNMAVYSIAWNPFHKGVFASCSADWSVKIWKESSPAAIFAFDLGNAVGDIAWSPYSSTVLSAVTTDGSVHVFDLSVDKYEPLCVQQIVKLGKLTHVSFNKAYPMLAVGDDRGGCFTLKLSPNLRKALSDKKLKEDDAQVAQLDKVLDSVIEVS